MRVRDDLSARVTRLEEVGCVQPSISLVLGEAAYSQHTRMSDTEEGPSASATSSSESGIRDSHMIREEIQAALRPTTSTSIAVSAAAISQSDPPGELGQALCGLWAPADAAWPQSHLPPQQLTLLAHGGTTTLSGRALHVPSCALLSPQATYLLTQSERPGALPDKCFSGCYFIGALLYMLPQAFSIKCKQYTL